MRRTTTQRPDKFLTFVTVLLVVAALYFAQDVLVPLVMAVMVSFLLTPLVRRLERFGLHRILAIGIVTSVVLGAVVGLGYVVANQAQSLAKNSEEYRGNILSKLQALRPKGGGVLDWFQDFSREVQEELAQPATTQSTTQSTTQAASQSTAAPTGTGIGTGTRTGTLNGDDKGRGRRDDVGKGKASTGQVPAVVARADGKPVLVEVADGNSTFFNRVTSFLGPALSPLGTAGIVAVFAIFMMLERENLRDRMLRLVGYGQLNITTKAVDEATNRISKYLVALTIVNGSYGVAISLGLWTVSKFFGEGITFPSVILWGLLCAILRFVPYIGPWIAAVFPIVLSIAVYPGFTMVVAVVLMFVTIELLSNNLMEPALYGRSTGMSTVAVLASAVFWTWLWGAEGLVLATPITVVIVVMGKYVPNLKFFDILLGDAQVFTPTERVYQRLLAGDSEEATEISVGLLDEMPLERLYGDVLMPVLAMAEQDRHRNVLSEESGEFIRQGMREIVDELGDRHRVRVAKGLEDGRVIAAQAVTAATKASAGVAPTITGSLTTVAVAAVTRVQAAAAVINGATPAMAEEQTHNRLVLPRDCEVSVMILPAHDDADEVVGLMVQQLLENRNYCAPLVPVTALASEMVQRVETEKSHLVVVSALPPDAVTHSRYLCKRLHLKLPDVPMFVGLWAYRGDVTKATDRIACVENTVVRTSLSAVLDDIDQRAQAIIVHQRNAAAMAETKTERASTEDDVMPT